MNTENIEEATITTENSATETGADDLLSKIKAATEIKTPGSTTAPIKSFWETSADDFEPQKKTAPAAAEEKKADENPKEKEKAAETSPGSKKITDRAKEGSARTAVGMLDLLHKTILTPIVNYKFKKKFTAEEITSLADKLAEAEIKELKDADLKLRLKWDKLMLKRDKLAEKIPFTDSESKELQEAFYNYFDITEKTLSPEWYLAFALINTTGNRIIDIAFE